MKNKQRWSSNLQKLMPCLRKRHGKLSDIDGTMSEYANTPAEACLHPRAAALLQESQQYGPTGVCTSRFLQDAAGMVNVPGITYIANKGLEMCIGGLPSESNPIYLHPEAEPFRDEIDRIRQALEDDVKLYPREMQGVVIEPKGVTLTVHYRLSPNRNAVGSYLQLLLERLVQGRNMKVEAGRLAWEVSPDLVVDKGTSLRWFVEHFNLTGVIYKGDDFGDIPAFIEVLRLRQEGMDAFSLLVRHADPQHPAPERLVALADIIVEGVDGLMDLWEECLAFQRSLRS